MAKLILTCILLTLIPPSAFADFLENSPLKKGRMLNAPHVNLGKTECAKKIPSSTRQMLFSYFYSTAKTSPRLATANIDKYAKIIGKIYKESSGNPVGYSDMSGKGSTKAVRAFYANDQKASISMFKNLRANKNVMRNPQTNIGLLQVSVDQMYWRSKVRKTFNETTKRFNKNPKEGLKMCGTSTVFSNSEAELLKEFKTFSQCQVGNRKRVTKHKTTPIVSDQEFNCFDKWVSYCPTLNIGLGLQLPPAYFETSDAAPLCKKELASLLKKAKRRNSNAQIEKIFYRVNEFNEIDELNKLFQPQMICI